MTRHSCVDSCYAPALVTATTIVLIIVGALIAWKIGSFALRVLGGFCVVLGLINLAIPDEMGAPIEIGVTVFGVLCWLAGHWLFAFRHHVYRSTLAQRIFLTILPTRMDPTRNWGFKTIDGQRP